MVRKLTVKQVKEIALAKYDIGGDTITECWTDQQIQDWLDEGHGRADLNRMIKNDESDRTERQNMLI